MRKTVSNYILLVVLAIIWGSSFILMKKGLEIYSYTEVAALRLLIAFISLSPFIFFAIKETKKRHWIPVFIVGIFGNMFPAFLFTKAQTVLESSLTGMLNSFTPFFTLLIVILFFNYRASQLNILGLIVGLLGVILLAFGDFSLQTIISFNIFYVILATFFYAVSINVIKYYLFDLDAIHISALAFLFCGPPMIPYLLGTEFLSLATTDVGFEALIYVIILAIIGTSIAIILFNYLLKRSSSIFAASVTYLIPIVAIFWGLIDGEKILIEYMIGVCMILLGVYLVNKEPFNQ